MEDLETTDDLDMPRRRVQGNFNLRRQKSEQGTSSRQCLQQRFAYSESAMTSSEAKGNKKNTGGTSRAGFFRISLPTLSISSISRTQTQQVLQHGQRTVQRALHEAASTFDLLSQRLRRSTRRRYRLTNSPFTPSPSAPTAGRRRQPRSPAAAAEKLYSPFGIETPAGGCCNAAMDMTPPVPPPRRRALNDVSNTPRRKVAPPPPPPPHSVPSWSQCSALGTAGAPPDGRFYSPTGRLRGDVAGATGSSRELAGLADRLARRSGRL